MAARLYRRERVDIDGLGTLVPTLHAGPDDVPEVDVVYTLELAPGAVASFAVGEVRRRPAVPGVSQVRGARVRADGLSFHPSRELVEALQRAADAACLPIPNFDEVLAEIRDPYLVRALRRPCPGRLLAMLQNQDALHPEARRIVPLIRARLEPDSPYLEEVLWLAARVGDTEGVAEAIESLLPNASPETPFLLGAWARARGDLHLAELVESVHLDVEPVLAEVAPGLQWFVGRVECPECGERLAPSRTESYPTLPDSLPGPWADLVRRFSGARCSCGWVGPEARER